MKTKFTPGPWSIYRPSFCGAYTLGIDSDSGTSVVLFDQGIAHDNKSTQEANAALIADAPAMFKLLDRVLKDVKSDRFHRLHDSIINDVRELLEKHGS